MIYIMDFSKITALTLPQLLSIRLIIQSFYNAFNDILAFQAHLFYGSDR